MQCPECETTMEDGADACPACGAAVTSPAPYARRIRVGFALTLGALFLGVFVVALLRSASPPSAPPASKVPTSSVEATQPPVDPHRAAIERTIGGFYATIDAGKPVTASPYVYAKGRGGIAPQQVESTSTTTFSVARAVVGSGTADIFGRESRTVIAPPQVEVEFRLRLVGGRWLISSWQIAPKAIAPPSVLALSSVTARDVVETLLQAHQVGDATVVRMLTTTRFQLAHGSWLDGRDKSALLVGYRIIDAKASGGRYLVTVAEDWKPTPLITTYTVIDSNGDILVDAWTWK